MKLRRIPQDTSRQRSVGGGAALPMRKRPLVEAIEPRRLYSADLHPAAVVWTPQEEIRLTDETPAAVEPEAQFTAQEQQPAKELVIVDGRVSDLNVLLDDLSQGGTREFDVIMLDTQRDGLEQISEALASRSNLSAIHVIGHGQAGAMDLGATHLDTQTLASHADAALAWGRALDAEGDILLYGCDVAAGDTGASFIAQLSHLTGADIAASTDITGNVLRGGNWTLEAATGGIEARVAFSAATQAAWQGTLGVAAAGSQTLVNTGNTTGNQFVGSMVETSNAQRSVAMDASGNYVVVWTSDAGEDGDGFSVLAQRYNAGGVAQGAAFEVNTAIVGDQTNAQVVMNASGQFAVVWELSNAVDSDILIRMFDAAGNPLGTDFQVDGGLTGLQGDATAVMDGAGNVAVFWTRNDGNGTGIYGNYVTAIPGLPYGPWQVNTTTTNDQLHATAVANANGDVVVAWEDFAADGSGTGIFAQRYLMTTGPGDINAVGSEFRINQNTTGDQERPSVSMDSNGNFVAAWQTDQNGNYDVYARRFAASGTPMGNEFRVNTNIADDRFMPTVAMRSSGGFLVSWVSTNGQDGASDGVYMRQYDVDGTALTAEVRVNTDTGGNQQTPTVALAANNNAVVVWHGFVTGDAWGVGMQRYTTTFSANTAPAITSNGGAATASISVSENTTAVTTVVASDADAPAQTLVYAITGGADATRFTIDSTTGALTFAVAPDYEAPNDANTDNAYVVTVTAYDGNLSDAQTITVTVTDSVESGTVTWLGSETRVNTTTAGTQIGTWLDRSHTATRNIGIDATGNYVVVFASDADDGSGWAVLAQRYDANGNALGGNFVVNTTTVNDQWAPQIIMNANGTFAVLWENDDGVDSDIYARLFDASGNALGNNFRITASSTDAQYYPTGVVDPNGNLLLVWTDSAADGDQESIVGRRFDATGTALGAQFVINTYTTDDQYEPSVAMDQAGNYVVVWEDFLRDGSWPGIYAQRFDAAGAPIGGDFRVNTTTVDNQERPSVAMDDAGNFVVVWQDVRSGTSYDVYGQRYDSSGNAVGGEFLVNTTQTSDRYKAAVTMRQGGGFVVAWEAVTGDGSSEGVYMRQYAADGTALTGEFRVNTTTAGSQQGPSIAIGHDGKAVVIWNGNGPGDADGVFMQRFAFSFANTAPLITSNGGTAFGAVSVAENSTAVTTVTITDVDSPAQTMAYSIVGGADAARFSINSSTGALSFAVAPNYESPNDADTNNIYLVKVQVSDGAGGVDTQTITVTVTNVNEAPVITSNGGGASAGVSIAENTTAVTTAAATDVDAATTLTYSISGGADAALFTINSSSGVLTFLAPPNFEAPADIGGNNVYDLIVQVSDGTLADTQAIAVTVTNANEAPVITSNGGGASTGVSVAENTTAVTTAAATDVDAATTLTYSISGGADAALFTINGSSGVLTFLAPPNFEAPADIGGNNVYDLIVQVSDGTLTDTQAIAVTVTNVNEAPVITSNGGGASASLNAWENRTVATTVAATDPDAAPTLTYSISGGADAARFTINGTTGALTFLVAPDAEAPTDANTDNVYLVNVTVSDGNGGSDAQALSITVVDGVDNIVGSQVQVNTVTAGNQWLQSGLNNATRNVGFDLAGDFIVVWQDSVADGSGWGIFAQRYNAAGVAQGANMQINTTTVGDQAEPQVVVREDGTFLVVWSYDSGSGKDIIARGFNLDGTPRTAEFVVNSTTAGNQSKPVVAVDTNFNFVIAWEDDTADAGTTSIYARRMDPVGVMLGADFRVNTTTVGAQYNPTVAMDLVGNFTVAWVSDDGSSTGVYAQRFDAAGVAQGAEFRVNTTTAGVQERPSIDMDDAGNFIVVWQGFDSSSGASSVYGQRYNAAGVAQGSEFKVNTDTGGERNFPSVAIRPDGTGFFVSWDSEFEDGSGWGVYLRQYNAAGTALTGETLVNTTTSGFQGVNNVAVDDNGRLVVVWNGDADPAAKGVFMQRYATSNNAPVITSNGGGATANVEAWENRTVAATVVATDMDLPTQTLTYSIAGGADAARFTIDGATGVLTFAVAPDYEVPTDANADNVYLVNVIVSDGNGGSDLQALSITVVNGIDNLAGGETMVNAPSADLQLAQLGFNGANRNVGVDSSGNLVVVWIDDAADGSGWGVFGQRYNAAGVAQGGNFQINTTTAGDQIDVQVLVGANGSFVVLWNYDNGTGANVYARRYDASGVAQGGEFIVNSVTAGDQKWPSGAMDASGNFVITWQDSAQDGSGSGIYARRYNAAGVAQGAEALIASTAAGNQAAPMLAMDASGNYTVVWQDENALDGGGIGIFGRRFNAAGVAQGSQFQINSTTAGDQVRPDIAMDSTGAFIVAWHGLDSSSGFTSVYAQRYDATGTALGSEFKVNTSTANDRNGPSVALRPGGGFFITWNALEEDGDNFGVYARQYDASGTAVTGETLVNTFVSDFQAFGSAAVDSTGRLTIVWHGNSSGPGKGIFMQSYASVFPNTAPTITSNGGGASANVNVAENGSTVTTVAATDIDFPTQTLSYSISGGADAGRFSINSSTGVLSFTAPPNFEAPNDANTDNIYQVTVQVSDGNGGTDTQAIAVTVTDVAYNAITVTSTTDTSDGDTSSMAALAANMGADGVISLREAIIAANNTVNETGVADRISFSIPAALVGGAHTISLTSALPSITDAVVIDGTTEPDHGATPMVVLDGTSAGGTSNGILLANGSSGSTIRGLVINNFAVHGICIDASDGNTIAGNYIGVAANGTAAAGNASAGVFIENGSDNNVIGGTAAADRNVISGNSDGVVAVSGNGNTILGNYIGTNAAGTAALGNTSDGVLIGGGTGITIGGTVAGAGNVISGNGHDAIELNGVTTATVAGNIIGLNAAGTAALVNANTGIRVTNGSTGITIGGTTAAARNVISGNLVGIQDSGGTGSTIIGNYLGLAADGSTAIGNTLTTIRVDASGGLIGGTTAAARNVISGNTGNGISLYGNNITVQGNYIGTDATGLLDRGNGDDGIWVADGTSGNIIGGTAAGAGNLVSGNTNNGIEIGNASGTVVAGNQIGTDATGNAGLGNGLAGVRINAGAANNTIGGTAAGAGNLIAYNGAEGILLASGANQGNSLLANRIHSNTGMGIDNDGDGVTANDVDDVDNGTNGLQNFPVLTGVSIVGPQVNFIGSLNSGASESFRIEFFASAAADASGHGEAQRYLGFVNVTLDGTGNYAFNTTLTASVAVGEFITATATSLVSNCTSEFSTNVVAVANSAPVISSGGGGASAAAAAWENRTVGTRVTATDADVGQTLTYSITGGADAARFTINASTGVLTFLTVPDFEAPADANADNVYLVTVQVSDGNGGTDTQAISITVVNGVDATAGAETAVSTPTGGLQVTQVGAGSAQRNIGMDAAGNIVVVWQDDTADGSGWGVYAQRFDSAGNPLGGNFLVNTTTTGDQRDAQLIVAADGSFVVMWNHDSGAGWDVYARRYDASGTALTGEFVVNTGTTGLQELPTGAIDASGNFVIVWQSDTGDGSSWGLYARRYNAAGVAQGSDFLVNTYTAGAQTDPSVAMDAAANFTVVWRDGGRDGSNGGVYGQRFNAAGVAQGSDFLVNTTTNNDQDRPSIGMDSAGNFVVIWQGWDSVSGFDSVFGQRYDAAGTAQGGEFQINTDNAANRNLATVTMRSTGDFFVTWNSETEDGSNSGVFMRQYDASGNAVTGETLVNTTISGLQSYASVAANGAGQLAVVWHGQIGGGNGIAMQRYAVPVANVAPTITSNGGGASANVNVAENTTSVATVAATDVNVPVQTLTYSISGGADAALFTINSSTGALSFVTAPNFESPTDAGANNVYDVIVQVSDGTLADTQAIAVTVTDANDAPVITSNGGGASASAGVIEGVTAITTVTATDADLPAQTLTYSITGGTDAARFTINSSTGALSLNIVPDYENPADANTDNIYVVTVSVSDGTGGTASQTISLSIIDSDDAAVITSNGGGTTASVSVAENTTAVTTVTSLDVDVPAQTITYRIIGGADAARFAINSSTGALTFLTAPDYEAPTDSNADNVYVVQLLADDGIVSNSGQTLSVTVTNGNDAPTITSNGGGANASINVAENTAAVTTVTAADIDVPAQTLTYSIFGGADAARFTINASTGVLSFLSTPDFELPSDANADGIYLLVVTASDGNGGSASQNISVTVTDTNEMPTITSNGGGATASITVAPRALAVTTITAADEDVPGQTLSYSIAGGADAALFTIDTITGALNFSLPQDGNTPTDVNGDSVYQVDVLVSDGNGGTRAQALSVRVQASGSSGATPTNPGNDAGGTRPIEVTTPGMPSDDGGSDGGIKLTTGPEAGNGGGASFESDLLDGTDSLSSTVSATINGANAASLMAVGANSSSATAAGVRHAAGALNDRFDAPIELMFHEVKLVAAEQMPLINSFGAPTYSSGARHGDWRAVNSDDASDEEDSAGPPAGKLSLMQIGSIAVAFGGAWWAMRASGILVSLLASTPTWRNFDPLPVLGSQDEDAAEDDNDPRLDDRSDPERRRDEVAVGELLDASEEH